MVWSQISSKKYKNIFYNKFGEQKCFWENALKKIFCCFCLMFCSASTKQSVSSIEIITLHSVWEDIEQLPSSRSKTMLKKSFVNDWTQYACVEILRHHMLTVFWYFQNMSSWKRIDVDYFHQRVADGFFEVVLWLLNKPLKK